MPAIVLTEKNREAFTQLRNALASGKWRYTLTTLWHDGAYCAVGVGLAIRGVDVASAVMEKYRSDGNYTNPSNLYRRFEDDYGVNAAVIWTVSDNAMHDENPWNRVIARIDQLLALT